MNKILYKLDNGKLSFWLMRNVPEFPQEQYVGEQYFGSLLDEYYRQFEQCKANALEIINWEYLPLICGLNPPGNLIGFSQKDGTPINENEPFDFPEGLEFKEEETLLPEQFASYPGQTSKVIRLIPKHKEEDDLWGEIYDGISFSETRATFINRNKSKFTIQRNKL